MCIRDSSYTEESIQEITVATDNVEAGKKLGEFAASLLKPEDQIAIVAHVKMCIRDSIREDRSRFRSLYMRWNM